MIERSRTPLEEIRFGVGDTPLGTVMVGFSKKGVVSISTGDEPEELLEELQRRFPRARLVPGTVEDKKIVKFVVKHIEDPKKNLDIKLDIRGTDFQKKVYKAIVALPFGETTTYAAIARKIGSPRAMRAVGSACSNCIISFAIPCYRVLRSDGVFYIRNDKGESRQKILLEREARVVRSEREARAGRRKKAA